LAVAFSGAACGSDGGGDPGDTPAGVDGDAAVDTQAPTGRPYLLAGRAEAFDVVATQVPRPWTPDLSAPGLELAEAVVIPADLYGIPWMAFTHGEQPQDLPGPWLAALTALEQAARALDRPIVLALSPLTPTWNTLAPAASDQGGSLVLNATWRGSCANPAQDVDPDRWRVAYGRYAAWMARRFEPRWVIIGQRLNRLEEACGPSMYATLQGFVAEAHARVGALTTVTPPTTIVTVDVEDLYGFPRKAGRCVAITPAECLAQRGDLLDGLEADVLGLESYPGAILRELADIPPDWLTRVAGRRADMTPAIAGTELPAMSLSRRDGVCVPLLESTPEAQAAWLDQVLSAADALRMPLVVWRTLGDLADPAVVGTCPCSGDPDLCFFLDGAGGDRLKLRLVAGLLAHDGVERQAAAVWRQAMATE